ncbi:cupin domain-containing protein [Rubrobacter marinus]|uniref:cupin domain-containing protein n=1 Tax=Rubrobacter marinus TaxID=2653852 RepID=UPI00140DAEA9|nr:cupin domain-containing protein [Rubrobacter marinus]
MKSWGSFPEVEVLPNNHRTSVAGLQVGVNRIRWVHPASTPDHRHDDAEQVILMLSGRMEMTIDGEEYEMAEGDVAVIPKGVSHHGRTLGEDAVFYEVFAPLRVQNLVGFIGKVF